MELRPRVFIGSSKEGLPIAEYIKSRIKAKVDCFLWTDDIFQYNESALETLLKEASLFDFGILVATKDDFTTSRDKSFDTPRDNIIFEFGLFIARLGTARAFAIQEKDAKLPSDLLGITVPSFEITTPLSASESLNKEIERIQKTIEEKFSLGELGLLPSTALAIGYFYNFVVITCESLYSKRAVTVDNKKFTNFEVNIVLPTTLDSDIKKRATLYFSRNNLQQIQIDCVSRSFPVFVSYDENEHATLKLFDVPTTLNGINKAIEMFMRKGHLGKTNQQMLLEERELRNFQRALQILINNDAFCKDMVKIIAE